MRRKRRKSLEGACTRSRERAHAAGSVRTQPESGLDGSVAPLAHSGDLVRVGGKCRSDLPFCSPGVRTAPPCCSPLARSTDRSSWHRTTRNISGNTGGEARNAVDVTLTPWLKVACRPRPRLQPVCDRLTGVDLQNKSRAQSQFYSQTLLHLDE